MHRIAGAAAAMGLAFGLAGCGGEKSVEAEAQVVGYARGIDVEVYEEQWVRYTDQDNIPSGEVRNVRSHEEFDGCKEVGDSIFGFETDDFECIRTWCSSEEGTHCEAQYKTEYDYDVKEDVLVEDCPAPLKRREFKNQEPYIDQGCLDRVRPDQKVSKLSRFVIWLRFTNPNYEVDKPANGHQVITASQEISAAEWQLVTGSTAATVKIRRGDIVSVDLNV